MPDDLNRPRRYCTFVKKKIPVFLVLLLLLSPLTAQAQKHPCHGAGDDLNGSLQVIMGRGGIWTFMEQSSLREKSVLGLKIDSKLSRVTVIFKTLCDKGKYPTKAIYDEIRGILGDGRMIFNLSKSSDEKKFEALNGLNQKLDALLSKLPS
tara:strand:- start:59 stop:511 length:453 start_codon:yes stop_codon:yes gene_type:complete